MSLPAIEHWLIDPLTKGIPGGIAPFELGRIGERGWNVLREDLPLPLAVLKQSGLEHNSRWMQRFLGLSGAAIAPHGKTTMSPQLFQRQLDDGAWGMTVGNVSQLQVARAFGVSRVLLANQLIGRQAIRYVLDELARDPRFDFYCVVDSVDGVRQIASAARAHGSAGAPRPVQVLVEGGYRGGRTGCRDLAAALAVAREVKQAAPYLALRGIEGFEGTVYALDPAEVKGTVSGLLDFLIEIAGACEREALFAEGPLILSAGGSSFFDLVAEKLAHAGLRRPYQVVIRSGCYLTHDSGFCQTAFEKIVARSPKAAAIGAGLMPAIEVWSYVQSRPEEGLAILTMGKRDCSYDIGLPVPRVSYRPGEARPKELGAGYQITNLNDQHAYLRLPADSPLKVGDLVGSGVSHPCTLFDKWQVLCVVDDDYNVRSAVRTFF